MRKISWPIAFVCLAFLFSIPRFVGLSTFELTGDEQAMQSIAVAENLKGKPADHGLQSIRGVYYGPFSIWVYQSLLLFTNDFATLRFWAVVLQSLAFGIGLYQIARLCPFLNPWFAVLPFLFPYFTFFSRLIWDFHAPLAVLACASYLTFLNSRRFLPLFLTGFVLTLSLLDHLKGLSSVAAIGLHCLIFRREVLKETWRRWVPALGFYLLISAPYLLFYWQHRKPLGYQFGGLVSLGFSLTGPILLSAIDISRYLGPGWYLSEGGSVWLFWIANASVVIYLFFYGGLVDMIRYVRSRAGKPGNAELEFCWLCFFALIFVTFLNLLMGIFNFPHYFSAVWIYVFGVAWFFLTRHWQSRIVRALTALYALSLIVCLVKLALNGMRWA